jgi:hypothetical protein
MQALLPADASTGSFPLPTYTSPNRVLPSKDLQWLGERLRIAYGPVEAPIPARLTELVERLARRDRPKD